MLAETFSGLRRNASMFLSIMLVTFISLVFVGAAALLQMQIGQMKSYWYDKAQVAVYLCTQYSPQQTCPDGAASAKEVADVKAKLESSVMTPYIKRYYFESSKQAYVNFKKQFQGSPVLQYVEPNQLAQTYWINLKDPSQWQIIQQSFSNTNGVDEVRDQRSYLDRIFSILNVASYTAVGVAALMLVTAMLLITTTIRLSAFSRRKEIGIMRLVGASNSFIQTPFILEGIVASVVGSVLAGGAIFVIVKFFVQDYLAASMPFTNFVGVREALIVWPAIVVFGVLLAAVASAMAIRRYLRV